MFRIPHVIAAMVLSAALALGSVAVFDGWNGRSEEVVQRGETEVMLSDDVRAALEADTGNILSNADPGNLTSDPAIPADPNPTAATACSAIEAEANLASATVSLSTHQAQYDSLKALGGPNPQLVSDMEYLVGVATRDVERARTGVADAAAQLAKAQTWDDYQFAQQAEQAAKDALVEAEAYLKKVQGDLARAKAGDPTINQQLSTLSKQIADDKAQIAQAKADIAECQ